MLEVSDGKGQVLANLLSRVAWYALADGVRLQVDEQAAWCVSCRRFTLAERLMTPDQAEKEIERGFWRKYPEERTPFLRDALRHRQHESISKRRPWFDYLETHRVSPPRCLECGGVDIAPLPADAGGDWVAHPSGSGWVRVACTLHVDSSIVRFFTPEGRRTG